MFGLLSGSQCFFWRLSELAVDDGGGGSERIGDFSTSRLVKNAGIYLWKIVFLLHNILFKFIYFLSKLQEMLDKQYIRKPSYYDV